MAVLCDNCGWFGDDSELIREPCFLDDDYMGTGPSLYYEYLCPECGLMDLTDGIICKHCDEFKNIDIKCACEDDNSG